MPGAYWIVDGFSFGHRRLYTLNHNLTYGWYVGSYPMPPVHPLALTQETALHISGQRVRVAAHVDGWGTAARRTVNLYARPHGTRRGHLVARARTDRYGNTRFAPRLTVSTRLTTVAPAVGHRHRLLGRLTIRPGVRLRDNVHDLAGHTSSNDLMPPGARPAFDVQVSPTHAGQCLFIQLDRGDDDNHWTPTYRGCVQIGTHGRVRYILPSDPQGLVRIRAVFKGDARNAPTSSAWRPVCNSAAHDCPLLGAVRPCCAPSVVRVRFAGRSARCLRLRCDARDLRSEVPLHGPVGPGAIHRKLLAGRVRL